MNPSTPPHGIRLRLSVALLLAGLFAGPSLIAANGTWTNLSGGAWNSSGNWSGGTIADGSGSTAFFNTLNLTANVALTLGEDRTIGTLNFGDTTPSNHGWALSGNILTLEGARTLTVGNLGTAAVTLNSVIAGSNGLTKDGAGTLVLAGENTYGGTTTVSAGRLVLANSNALGTSNVNIGSTGALALQGGITINRTAAIAGPGDTTVSLLNLSGNNTWSGGIATSGTGTRIQSDAGNLTIDGDIAHGGSSFLTFQGNGTITINGNLSGSSSNYLGRGATGTGTLFMVGAKTYTTQTGINAGILSINTIANGGVASGLGMSSNSANNLAFAIGANFTGTLQYTGTSASTDRNFTIGTADGTSANSTAVWDITQTSTTLTVTGGASNTGGSDTMGNLRKTGQGRLIFSGTNRYTGTTTITAGTLQFGKQTALYNSSPVSWTADKIIVESGATAAFNVGGSGEFTAANITALKALGTASGGFKNGSFLGLDTTNAAGGVFTYSPVIGNPNSGANVLGVTKLGANTLVLSGANTYTGATLVTAGTLIVNGDQSTATGAVTVQSGATLGGSGTLGGATTISGTHSPGNSPGIQTFTNGLAYSSGAQLIWELSGNTDSGRGVNFDGINVTGGNLSFANGLTASLVFTGVDFSDSFWSTGRSWLVYDVGPGFTTATDTAIFSSLQIQDGGPLPSGWGFSFSQNGNDVYLNYGVIPEPATTLLLTGGLMVLVLRRRRAHHSS